MKRHLHFALRDAEAVSSRSYVPQDHWAQRLFQQMPESLGTLGSKPGSLLGCGFAKPKLEIACCSGNSLQMGTQISCASLSTRNVIR